MSWRARGLSDRLPAGDSERTAVQRFDVCGRSPRRIRDFSRQVRLRFFVPVRSRAGFAIQNPVRQENSQASRREIPTLLALRFPLRFRPAPAGFRRRLLRAWRAVVLQIRLPGRDAGRRRSPRALEQRDEGGGRFSVQVENRDSSCHAFFFYYNIPSFLPVCVSARSRLRHVQQNFVLPLQNRFKKMTGGTLFP